LAILGGVGALMGVNAGYLKPSVKWGAWPKVIGAGLFGYVIGKYSYQAKCAEKLMQLPNSEIGRILRERSGKTKGEFFDGNAFSPVVTPGNHGFDSPSFQTDYKSDIDIDTHSTMNSLDMDYRPDYESLSDNKLNEIPFPTFNTPTSYDELRARNRQEYDRTQQNRPIYRPPPPPNTQPIWDNQSYPPSDQMRNPVQKESRNQYGDVFNN